MPALLRPLLAVWLFSSLSAAQCDLHWSYAAPRPGLTQGAAINEIVPWDPDGAGPADPVLLVAGFFSFPGAQNLATWVPTKQRWMDHLPGPNGSVRAMTTLPNGDVVIGGHFSMVGTTTARNIARWDGSQWHAFGVGLGALVETVAVASNGELVAGGYFRWTGTQPALHVARWDGAQWRALGSGFDNAVMALTTAANGDLIAAGQFDSSGTTATQGVARFNGTDWVSVGSGLPGTVMAIHILPNGDLAAGGDLQLPSSSGPTNVARFDGTAWSGIGQQPVGAFIRTLEVDDSGNLYAGGLVQQSTHHTRPFLGRFDGASWTSHLDESGYVSDVYAASGGQVLCAGLWNKIDGMRTPAIARFDGTTWMPMGLGIDAAPSAAIAMHNGDLLIAGDFEAVDGRRARHIARRSGTATSGYTWSSVGGGIDGHVGALLQLPNGDVIARGQFTTAGGVPVQNVARWDGGSWHAMGSVAGAQFQRANLACVDGQLFSSSDTEIVIWDGGQWTSVGTMAGSGTFSLEPAGSDLIVSGAFTAISGVPASNIARWDGNGWFAFGAGLPFPVSATILTQDGKLIASYSNHLLHGGNAIWDGAAWQPYAQGTVHALANDILELPNGDLVFAGQVQSLSGPPVYGIGRWDGSTWSPFDGGVGLPMSVALLPAGELVVAGSLLEANGQASPHLASVWTTCPAATSSSFAACPGASGPQLTADTQPWLGSNLRTTASGLPANGWAVTVYGSTATVTSLPTLLPQSLPGCKLLVTPDVAVSQTVTASGLAHNSFALPSSAVLAGLDLHQQVIALAIDATGSIVAASASNALAMTLGSF